MQDSFAPQNVTKGDGIVSDPVETLHDGALQEAGVHRWESAPLMDEDRTIFFACRRAWLEGTTDAEEDIDEEAYDTTSTNPKDIFPYLVTMGYKDEKERMEESMVQILRIKELRKKYNMPPVSEKPWTPEWNFPCKSNGEIEQQWPLHESGTDAEGRLVL